MWGWFAVGLSGLIHMSAAEFGSKRLSEVFKPITLMILLLMLTYSSDAFTPHTVWIAGGLALSVIGDLLKSFNKITDKCHFIIFLVVYTCYSKSLWLQLSGGISWWLPSLLFASAVIVFFLMLPKLDSLIFPVLIMGLFLVQLCWAATELWLKAPEFAHLLSCLGAFVFAFSALMRALSYYQTKSKNTLFMVSGSYLLAQSFFVASAIYG